MKQFKTNNQQLGRCIRRNWDLYLLLLVVSAYFFIFHYIPMYGLQIAFKDYLLKEGIWQSPWVGFKHFERFFNSYFFWRLLGNTIGLKLYSLILGFPLPIILAISINEANNTLFKKAVQNITYIPHFLSMVVVVGMLFTIFSPTNGIVNKFLAGFREEPIRFMEDPRYFKSMYVFSGIWQNMGYSSIIYLAALSGINPELYESAIIDGADKLKRIIHISIPGIVPTIIILLILSLGRLMQVGFQKVLLMQNDLNLSSSDVIATYVYRAGIVGAQYSFSTAVGLFNTIINFLLIVIANKISKKVSEISLW